MTYGKRSMLAPMAYVSPFPQTQGPAPGKRTLTEGLAQQVHQQEKQTCDGRTDDGCFLSVEDRRRLDDDIRTNISHAALAWTTALTNKRIDLLAKHKEGWSTLWKIGAAIALGAIPIGVDIGVEFAAEAETVQGMQVAARLVNHQKAVEQVLDFAGEQVVEHVKDAVNDTAKERSSDQPAEYLSTQLDGPGQWGVALEKRFPKQLDDLGRLLLLGVTDPKVMTVAAFTRQIDALLARWQEQVGDLGQAQHGYGQTLNRTVAWISSDDGSAQRLALVDAWMPPGGLDNNLIPRVFVKWVDEDMVPYALEMQEQRRLADSYVGVVTLGDLSNAPTDPESMAWRREGDPALGGHEEI
jgi:hypothetical protein